MVSRYLMLEISIGVTLLQHHLHAISCYIVVFSLTTFVHLESPRQQQTVVTQPVPAPVAQPAAVSSQYGMGNQNMNAGAGNQNYIGSLVQVCISCES